MALELGPAPATGSAEYDAWFKAASIELLQAIHTELLRIRFGTDLGHEEDSEQALAE